MWKAKCPVCDGEGGWIEPVLDYGQGPYYRCIYCNRNGSVSILKWLDYKVSVWYVERIRGPIQLKKYRREYLEKDIKRR